MLAAIGGTIAVVDGWAYGPEIHSTERWTVARLDQEMPGLLDKALPGADITGRRPAR